MAIWLGATFECGQARVHAQRGALARAHAALGHMATCRAKTAEAKGQRTRRHGVIVCPWGDRASPDLSRWVTIFSTAAASVRLR